MELSDELPTNIQSINNWNNNEINKESFQFLYITGEGSFCKVWKAQHKKSHLYVAIKEISKLTITSKKYLDSIMTEKNILCELKHNFITNIYSSFQDKENLYLVLDYHCGGDLRFYTLHHKKITEKQLRIEYIHSKGIIHRDIKPENILCDEKGYFHICDFSLAKKIGNRVLIGKDISGTPGYIAPEAILQETSSYEVDFFAIGVIIYEILFCKLPYTAKTKDKMKSEFHDKDITLFPEEIPKGFHRNELCDFINRLLYIDRTKRLGKDGVNEIKNHPWLKEFNWVALKYRKIISDFIPKTGVFYVRKPKDNDNNNNQIKKLDQSILDDIVFQQQFENYNTFQRDISRDNFKRLLTMRDTVSITEKFLLAKRFNTSLKHITTSKIHNNNENDNSNRSISNEQKLLKSKLLLSSCKPKQMQLTFNSSTLISNKSSTINAKRTMLKSSSTIDNKTSKHVYNKSEVITINHKYRNSSVIKQLPKIIKPFSLYASPDITKSKYRNTKSPINNNTPLSRNKYITKMLLTTSNALYDNRLINMKLNLLRHQKLHYK